MLYSRNWHNIANQLYFSKINFKKEKGETHILLISYLIIRKTTYNVKEVVLSEKVKATHFDVFIHLRKCISLYTVGKIPKPVKESLIKL